MKLDRILLYCRAGFENECAAEISSLAAVAGVQGYARGQKDSGYVFFAPHDSEQVPGLRQRLRFEHMVFPRQLIWCGDALRELDTADRVTPLLAAAREAGGPFGQVLAETADTNEAKELASFCRKFGNAFAAGAKAKKLLVASETGQWLHLFFLDGRTVHVGVSDPNNRSTWPMGIPRLKFPGGAPSRSTLKLAEAIMVFLGDDDRQRLKPGMRAVDLGAAPGGWTWQLARRGLLVMAVDNGPMAESVMATGLVEHVRMDAFRFKPKKPVDWMVCDVVEQPSRMAALVARWLVEGLCRETIFNLKLPMKKRWQELQACRAIIDSAMDGRRYRLCFKQLYHDREEVTGHLRRL